MAQFGPKALEGGVVVSFPARSLLAMQSSAYRPMTDDKETYSCGEVFIPFICKKAIRGNMSW